MLLRGQRLRFLARFRCGLLFRTRSRLHRPDQHPRLLDASLVDQPPRRFRQSQPGDHADRTDHRTDGEQQPPAVRQVRVAAANGA